ncbi:MAG: hypothetical protein LAT51_13405 [Flavobacteriaceae bacterium]|nr:hypothetical protein [Flavobacteriaceae bacterium]
MKKIDVDDQVFSFLQKQAIPFEDTPNTVLRRLLFEKENKPRSNLKSDKIERKEDARKSIDTDTFVKSVLRKYFDENFKKVPPFRYMFDLPDKLVYFQNFNEQYSENLWYRLRKSALDKLRRSNKNAFICFTNPSDNLYYAIPIESIEEKSQSSDWERNDIEVNIDHKHRRWREFDWNIRKFLTENAI